MIAVANGTVENPASTMIHCYRVSVKRQMDNLTITSQSLPSFFLTGGAARDIPGESQIASILNFHIQFALKRSIKLKTPAITFQTFQLLI